MIKHKLLVAFLSCFLLLSFVSATENTFCYQETATESTECGGLDTGSQQCGTFNNCPNIYDGDWNTYANLNYMLTGTYEMNYTKPYLAVGGSWQIKQVQAGTTNLTIPEDCWNFYERDLILRIQSNRGPSPQIGSTTFSCYDGGWNDFGSWSQTEIYEEAMSWELDHDEYVDPLTIILLPQVTSTVDLDTVGYERTYLYCTWQIDSIGEQAVQMSGMNCPETQENFTIEQDETYFVSIDYAEVSYNVSNASWQIDEVGNAGSLEKDYIVDIPEPDQDFFDDVFDAIFQTIKSVLCNIFPWLGFCAP